MTGSERSLGMIDASSVLPGVFVGLFAGALADRVSPKRMVIVMLLGQMALASGLAWLVATNQVRIWHMGAILAANRVCVTFELPSRQIILYNLVGREHLMNAIALNSGLFNVSRVIGPALAGFLLFRLGSAACFTLNALSFLAAIAAMLAIRPVDRDRSADRPQNARATLLAGLHFVYGDRSVRLLYHLMIAFGIIGMGYAALAPAFASKVLGKGPIGYSLLLSSAGLGATLGALVVASIGGLKRKEYLVFLGIIFFGVALTGASLSPALLDFLGLAALRFPVCCGFFFLAGFGGLLFYSSTQTLVQLAAPDVIRGRVIGIWMIGFAGSVPLGSLWAGWAAEAFGVTTILGISAILEFLLACAALAFGLLSDDQPRTD